MTKKTVNNNTVNNTTNNYYDDAEVRRKRRLKRRERLTAKLKKEAELKQAPPNNQQRMDVKKYVLAHYHHVCITTDIHGCHGINDPVIRFERRMKDGVRTFDRIYLSTKAWEVFGLTKGMALSLFTDNPDNPKYLFIQNVTKHFDAPAHIHREGHYELQLETRTGGHNDHVCNKGTTTPAGYICNGGRGKYPMPLFGKHPGLIGKWGRLYQVVEEGKNYDECPHDLLVVDLTTLEDIKRRENPIEERAVRTDVTFCESTARPRNISRLQKHLVLSNQTVAGTVP